MSETDTEIVWRATVEDARAYLRGEVANPEPGTLAGEIHQFCNRKAVESYARGAGVEAENWKRRLSASIHNISQWKENEVKAIVRDEADKFQTRMIAYLVAALIAGGAFGALAVKAIQ